MKDDLQTLFTIENRGIAEEVQEFLEEKGLYTLLTTDNPASSVMNAFMGSNPMEKIELMVSKADYPKAKAALMESPYRELIQL